MHQTATQVTEHLRRQLQIGREDGSADERDWEDGEGSINVANIEDIQLEVEDMEKQEDSEEESIDNEFNAFVSPAKPKGLINIFQELLHFVSHLHLCHQQMLKV